MSVDDEAGDEAVPRAASPGALSRRRLLKAAEHGCSVWYFEVKLGGPRAGEVAKQLPPGRPHLRAVRLSLCERLDRAAGASVAWPRPGLLCVYLVVSQGSSSSQWLAGAHGDGSLAEAVKGSLLRAAPRGYEVLEIESLSPPLVVKDFWVNVPEDVLDLGVELSGAPLHEASIVRAFLGGLVWGHGLQARDLLVWIEGRPTSEMSPEEVSEELRAVRPLRLGFVRLASQGFEVRVASPGRSRSPGAGDLGQVDQELQELRERRQHLQQLQQKLVEVQSQAAQQEAAASPRRPRTPLAEEASFQQGYFQESLPSGYPQTSQDFQQASFPQTPVQQPGSAHLPQIQVHAQSQQPGHFTSAGAPAQFQQSVYPNPAHGPGHLHPSTSVAGAASFQPGQQQVSSARGPAHLQQPGYSQMPSASGPPGPGCCGGPAASGPTPFQPGPGSPQVSPGQGAAQLQQPGYPQTPGSGPTRQPGYPQASAAHGSAHQQPGYLHASAQAEASQQPGHSQMLQARQQQAALAGGQQGAFPQMPQVSAHPQQQGSSYPPVQSPFEPGYSQTAQLQSQMPQTGALFQPGHPQMPSADGSAQLQPGYQQPGVATQALNLAGCGAHGLGGLVAQAPNLAMPGEHGLGGPRGCGSGSVEGGGVAGAFGAPLGSGDASGFLGGLEGGSAALAQAPQELMSQAASAVLGGTAESVTMEEMSEPKKLEEEQSKAKAAEEESSQAAAGREERESSQSEELKAMCERQEQEVLLPALAAAKAETEEATARGFYAREAATEEVASELQEVREEKMQVLVSSEEAEARLCERTAEMQLRYETEEQESLLPALAAARVEKEEAAARGFYARESAMEEVASELQKIREEQTQASVAADEAEEKLEMAKAREQVTAECEEAAAKEVKNWEELLQQREKEILSQSELRDREHEAAFAARYEKQERELLFPAVSAAKAETEEAAARGFYAREAAMEEVQSEVRKLREEQSLCTLSREEAQEAMAKAIRQDSLTREMEDQAAMEVSKWEAQLAAREQSLKSQREHQEREFLGEAKTEQQLSSALRVRELALRAGEEDLKAKLRSREHVILQEQREMEALEKRAEEMMALALKRRQHLLVEEQKEAEALELRAEQRSRELLAETEDKRRALQGEAQESLEAAEQRAQELLREAEERREEVMLQEERELEAMEKQVEELTAEKQAQVEASGAQPSPVRMKQVHTGILELVATGAHGHLGFEAMHSVKSNAMEVVKVEAGTWAQRMRVRLGDHLLSIDSAAVGSFTEEGLLEAIRGRTRPARLRFRRLGQDGLDEDQRRLEVIATEGDVDLGFQTAGEPPGEVFVSKVLPGSWAAQRGLQERDELVAVAGHPVSSLKGEAFAKQLKSVRPLRLRFHLAPGGPQPPRTKSKPEPKIKAEPEVKEAPEAQPKAVAGAEAKAKGRLGRAKLAQMLVGDLMQGRGQEEELGDVSPERSVQAPSSPVTPAAQSSSARPPSPPKPSAPVAKRSPPPPAPPKAKAGASVRPSEREAPRAGLRTQAAEESTDDDAMLDAHAGKQDKILGFEIAQRGSQSAFMVSAVSPGSWATRHRIRVGNELVSIGDKSAKKLTLEEVKTMLSPDGVRPLMLWFRADMGG